MQTQQTAEINLLWATLILEELARLGVKHICMAPGSRSTPLVFAAMGQKKLTHHSHFDERGLGFMALGLAKASQTPVAIITTSGTAVANLYPAIIEAWLTKIPLIVLSADRPSELIQCGANQAIIQNGIFADYAKALNLPTANLGMPAEALLSSIDELVANQVQPVHINCMYREPLYPAKISVNAEQLYAQFSAYLSGLVSWSYSNNPYYRFSSNQLSSLPSATEIRDFSDAKGVIIAGILSPQDNPQALIKLAQRLGWPLLTDAQCQLRQNIDAIGHIDQLFHAGKTIELLEQAEHVLVFGGRLLSKRLINYLAKQNWQQYWQVLPFQERLDPSHKSKQIWLTDLSSFTALPWKASPNAHWANGLIDDNLHLEQLFINQIDDSEFGEAQVIRKICQHHQTKQLFIGNSLPVRLFDMFAPILNNAQNFPFTYTNRGASGIDGLLATACGIAANEDQATTFIVGDLSQLHDLNSLAIARNLNSTLVIVILNNDGGNIFNLLPVANETVRSQYYRLSHGLSFEHVAIMFELPYAAPTDIDSFHLAYEKAVAHRGASVIEVKVSSHQASNQISAIANIIRQG